MREIHLVRHAETFPDPQRPPTSWDLAATGHAAAASLKGVLPAPVFSSPEPKALQTARRLTDEPVEIIEAFGEHRPETGAFLSSGDFARSVECYFGDGKTVCGANHIARRQRGSGQA